jgi:hypothetical protein
MAQPVTPRNHRRDSTHLRMPRLSNFDTVRGHEPHMAQWPAQPFVIGALGGERLRGEPGQEPRDEVLHGVGSTRAKLVSSTTITTMIEITSSSSKLILDERFIGKTPFRPDPGFTAPLAHWAATSARSKVSETDMHAACRR